MGFHLYIIREDQPPEHLSSANATAQEAFWFAEWYSAKHGVHVVIRDQLVDEDLWDANPRCLHETYSASGGGIKCRRCSGWFCF